MNTASKNLNELQLHFLQFFSEIEVSEKETNDIKNMVSNYYFEKAEKAIQAAIIERNIDINDLENNPDLHYRATKR